MAKFDANQESQFGVLPVMKEDRVYNLFDNSCINVGLAIATWCFMIGGSVALFVDFWPAVIATLVGNMISVLVMAIMPCSASATTGADNYTLAASYMGRNGRYILMAFITIFQIAWLIVLSIMFARSVSNVTAAFMGVESMSPMFTMIISLIAVAIVFLVVWKGPLVIKRFNNVVAPMMVIVIIGLLVILSRNIGWDVITSADPIAPNDNQWVNFLLAVELSFGAGLSWWPNMGGMSRLCKTTKAAYWANLAGLILAATVGTALGVAAAITIGSDDPTEWMLPLGGLVFGVIALIFVAIANVTSNATVAYNICLGLKDIKIFRDKKWAIVVAIFLVPVAIGLILFPNQIYDHFYILLGVTCTFYVPVVTISTIDYFVLRKKKLDIRGLYDRTSTSVYSYWGGFNWVAILVFALAMPFYLVFLNPATLVYQTPFMYCTASGGVFVVVAIVYYILAKVFLVNKGIGGYRK
ncbi:cytosine permease [Anaerovorax odorimutans]|uniref:Cytosine permease n=1 Tax=Anaerovorax odorimutans TaxID=109327 RepID=A0ABT1RJ33_9FIRM|nr:cytosine permease [Anaerovorax odorimutans]MCQ4635197.1 cytosine permease [Anaerovorax odorimutans]